MRCPVPAGPAQRHGAWELSQAPLPHSPSSPTSHPPGFLGLAVFSVSQEKAQDCGHLGIGFDWLCCGSQAFFIGLILQKFGIPLN